MDYGEQHQLERRLQEQSFEYENPRQNLLYTDADPNPFRIKKIDPLIARMGEVDTLGKRIQRLVTDVRELRRRLSVCHTENELSHSMLLFLTLQFVTDTSKNGCNMDAASISISYKRSRQRSVGCMFRKF